MPNFDAQMRGDQVLDEATVIDILQERASAGLAEAAQRDVVAALVITTMMTPQGQHAVVSFRGDPTHLKTAVETQTPHLLIALDAAAAEAKSATRDRSRPTVRSSRRSPGGAWGMFRRR